MLLVWAASGETVSLLGGGGGASGEGERARAPPTSHRLAPRTLRRPAPKVRAGAPRGGGGEHRRTREVHCAVEKQIIFITVQYFWIFSNSVGELLWSWCVLRTEELVQHVSPTPPRCGGLSQLCEAGELEWVMGRLDVSGRVHGAQAALKACRHLRFLDASGNELGSAEDGRRKGGGRS